MIKLQEHTVSMYSPLGRRDMLASLTVWRSGDESSGSRLKVGSKVVIASKPHPSP